LLKRSFWAITTEYYMKSHGRNAVSKTLPASITQGRPGKVIDADYFYFDVSPRSKTPLAIICGGYEKCAPDFEINRVNYPYFFIKCTVGGKGILKIKNREYKLSPGVLTGFAPGTPHHYICDSKKPMEHIFITFVGTEAKALLKASLLSDKGIVEPFNPSAVRELIEKIYEIGSDKKQYSQQIFKKYYRNSPHEYVMRLKLNKAANLLLTSMLSIKEIAYSVGFGDQYHFSRNFKKFHLLSPSDYRSRTRSIL